MNKIKNTIKQLESDDSKEVLKGLLKIKSNGNYKIIPHLIKLANSKNDHIRKNTIAILSELKDSKSSDVIIEELQKIEDPVLISEILNTIWNSGLDYSKKISDLVSLGLKSGYMANFEVLTIIENMEGPFDENDLLESQLKINQSLNSQNNHKSVQILILLKKEIERLLQSI